MKQAHYSKNKIIMVLGKKVCNQNLTYSPDQQSACFFVKNIPEIHE